jgi:hypothetical protein
MPDANPQAIQEYLEKNPDISPSQREWFQMMLKDEPLDPELAAWIDDTESLGQMIKHPLVYDITGVQFPAPANARLKQKKEALARAYAEKDWNTVVYLHERPHRANALYRLAVDHGAEISNEDYWELVGSVWVDSENIYQNEDEWEFLLSSERPGREHMMDEEERAAFAALPDTLTVYRGCHRELNEDGLSWTLDRDRAAWFAKRFASVTGSDPIVHVGEVSKSQVVAHFLGRNEAEIVLIEPEAVRRDHLEDA